MASPPSPPKIFMVEDDAELRKGWADVFDLLGYEFRSHHRGLEALKDKDGIRSSNILITDYYLPDINGAELVKRVKESSPGIKAIVLTGSREPTVVEAIRKTGHCTLLHKPVNIDTLEAEILRLLGYGAA